MANVVKAALLQAKWTGDTASMIDVHEGYARTAAQQGAQIIGFQEVFNAPYFCQVQETEHYRWAEPVPDGPTVQRMRELARETGLVLVVPVFEVEDAGLLLQHRRRHRRGRHGARQVPQAPHPAGEGILGEVLLPARQPGLAGVRHRRRARSASTSATTGTSPRAGVRSGSAGAQIVYNPSATSRGLSSHLWQLEQPAAAVANEYFVAAINRVGVEEYGDNDFYGTSYFVDPRGQFVGDVASAHDEELVVRDLDLDLIEEVRQTWAFYRDRRPDAYGPLVQA